MANQAFKVLQCPYDHLVTTH